MKREVRKNERQNRVGIKSTGTKRRWNEKGKGKKDGRKGGRERDRVC